MLCAFQPCRAFRWHDTMNDMAIQKRARVFLADDHALVREQLTALIEQETGLELCGQAADASTALTLILQHHPDLVILDLSQRQSGGPELLKNLSSRLPDVPVLVLSMYDEARYAEWMLRAGAKGFITRQEATVNILTAIRTLLAGETYVSESINRQRAQSKVRTKGHGAQSWILVALFAWITVLSGRTAFGAEESFSFVILPDSQYMVAYDQASWLRQCKWIVDHKVSHNIRAVIHVGDLVNDAPLLYQWTNALAGMNLIKNAGIPFILAPGNHDMDTNGLSQVMNIMDQYLPPSWFTSNSNWVGGFLDDNTLAGSYLLVTNGPTTYLIVALAYVPDERLVNWARGIMNQFSQCPAIFVTHCYTEDTDWGRRASWSEDYTIERTFGDSTRWWTPNRMWNEWLRQSSNLFWVISGHLSLKRNSMYFCERADDGHVVTQSLCDYQWPVQGVNDGIMQLLTVLPEQQQCHIETLSPISGIGSYTNWYENYTFPLLTSALTHVSRWLTAQVAATNGLVLWNGFDQTNTSGFVDLSPYSLCMTGAIATAPGGIYLNSYLAFSNMVHADDMDAMTGLSNFTVSVWFKTTNNATMTGVLAGKFAGNTDGEWYLATLNPSRLRLALVNTNNLRINLDLPTPVPMNDGQWHYAVATYDGAEAKIYLDGDSIGGAPYSGRLKGTRQPVTFGGLYGQSSPNRSAYTPLAWMDRAKVWNRALSKEEIMTAYAHDLNTLASNSVTSLVSTNVDVVTVPGSQYLLRFAVAGRPSPSPQQQLVVSWDGTPISSLSLYATNTGSSTNWVYASAFVSSTSTVSRLQCAKIINELELDSTTPADMTPELIDISALPFTPPVMVSMAPSSDEDARFSFDVQPGFLYRLVVSSDLATWTPVTDWATTSDPSLVLAAARTAEDRRFYRVEVKP